MCVREAPPQGCFCGGGIGNIKIAMFSAKTHSRFQRVHSAKPFHRAHPAKLEPIRRDRAHPAGREPIRLTLEPIRRAEWTLLQKNHSGRKQSPSGKGSPSGEKRVHPATRHNFCNAFCTFCSRRLEPIRRLRGDPPNGIPFGAERALFGRAGEIGA